VSQSDDDFLDADDLTIVDDDGKITPLELPRCTECGRVVFFDDFTDIAKTVSLDLFSRDRCVRAKDGHWWWCGKRWRLVYTPPR
jgi:hypothetical protein